MSKPILFSTPMVQAVKEDRKDITRRCNGLHEINKSPDLYRIPARFHSEHERLNTAGKIYFAHTSDEAKGITVKAPYGPAGTILWVRESFHYANTPNPEVLNYQFKDGSKGAEIPDGECYKINDYDRLRPSIHMPKAAARIWLKVISTRAERLHDITEEDCAREGIEYVRDENGLNRYRHYDSKAGNEKYYSHAFAIDSFRSLWVSINGQESWDSNPWVFRVELEVLSTTGKPADLCE